MALSRSVVIGVSPRNQESAHLLYGCKVCYDPHGISASQGNTTYISRLINLSTTDVTPVGTGATASATCKACHNKGGQFRREARFDRLRSQFPLSTIEMRRLQARS